MVLDRELPLRRRTGEMMEHVYHIIESYQERCARNKLLRGEAES
jgi:hypothetical protein